MCITKSQLMELNEIITTINSLDDEDKAREYLIGVVEDVDMFFTTLKMVNKNKLYKKKKAEKSVKNSIPDFTEEFVFEVFANNSLEEIVKKYTKVELSKMYLAIYDTKPLSAERKEDIVQAIKQYMNNVARTKALLG